jgi:hypothetical protein
MKLADDGLAQHPQQRQIPAVEEARSEAEDEHVVARQRAHEEVRTHRGPKKEPAGLPELRRSRTADLPPRQLLHHT